MYRLFPLQLFGMKKGRQSGAFAVNREEEALPVEADFRAFPGLEVKEYICMTCDDMNAVNDFSDPYRVVPHAARRHRGERRFRHTSRSLLECYTPGITPNIFSPVRARRFYCSGIFAPSYDETHKNRKLWAGE